MIILIKVMMEKFTDQQTSDISQCFVSPVYVVYIMINKSFSIRLAFVSVCSVSTQVFHVHIENSNR